MMTISLEGIWQCSIPGQQAPMQVPGTLDESGIGHPDANANQWHPDAQTNAALADCGVIATRLTRRYTYEGPAEISRTLSWQPPAGKRVFLEVERARCLSLRVNGTAVPHHVPMTIVTPHVFEITGLLTGQNDQLVLTADNSYPGLPHDAIVYSSAATDETQTNWNGLLGYVRLRVEEAAFISAVQVYPQGDTVEVQCEVDAPEGWQDDLTVCSTCLAMQAMRPARAGMNVLGSLPLRPEVCRWDEDESSLYQLTVSGLCVEPVTVTFGVRDFASAEGRLTLNGRPVFLRSEANCAVFPETGYPPMTVDAWTKILNTYHSYGVNCIRFHSHMPPEAAFIAADRMGMLMQPELSHWNPRTAFEDDVSYRYYMDELRQSIRWLANHPSFVMLTFGNELAAGPVGHARMDELLELAHQLDRTRLYANASNGHYGNAGCDAGSDFYASQSYYEHMIRATCSNMEGYLNHRVPDACMDFRQGLSAIRTTYQKPVFTFEVGQYEVLPDFDELNDFHGVTRPDNLALIQQRMKKHGLEQEWKRRVEATGELSNLCYREEYEAALRTEGLSGISLLGLQDFPGQGTALVGMLNSHLQPKPFDFASPERFSSFFSGERPLVLLPRYAYQSSDTLTAPVRFANYGKADRWGALTWTLTDGTVTLAGQAPECCAKQGTLTDIGMLSAELGLFPAPTKLRLTVCFDNTSIDYPLWVYHQVTPACPDDVYETVSLDAAAISVLAQGGKVYLTPPSCKEALPTAVQAQFSTDFWSVGTFSGQSGAMGQLIDAAHPIFDGFPTQSHTDWQWWPMAGRMAVVLPEYIQTIITEMDCYAYMRPMAQLFECRCGGGRLMFSSLGLQDLQQYTEARALLAALYAYMGSERFQPEQELPLTMILSLVKEC